MSALPSSLPLDGVRVLDLSRVLAGPMCAMALADLGADVIKVEPPGTGDQTRGAMGFKMKGPDSMGFLNMNRNKRSITLDLQTPEGVKIVHDLLPQFDVVIHNFKTCGAEKLGLGYEQ
ncbi:CoA transferase, partial [Burkholderia sola]|uniref:CoA transferase n=1 Tax=Burkholderia sola TaxID=2843302 RepID=UPI00338EC763